VLLAVLLRGRRLLSRPRANHPKPGSGIGNFSPGVRVLAACEEPLVPSQPKGGDAMSVLIGILITFLVVILVLYLINMLPLDGRAKQIARVIVIIIGIISLLKYLAVF
jgi:hypothetical protein